MPHAMYASGAASPHLDLALELARGRAGAREEGGAVAVLVAVDDADRLVQRLRLHHAWDFWLGFCQSFLSMNYN